MSQTHNQICEDCGFVFQTSRFDRDLCPHCRAVAGELLERPAPADDFEISNDLRLRGLPHNEHDWENVVREYEEALSVLS